MPDVAARGFGDTEVAEVADVIAAADQSEFADSDAAGSRGRESGLAGQLPIRPGLGSAGAN